MIHSMKRIFGLGIFACFALYSYAQCCPEKEKVGQRDQFLYDKDVIVLDAYMDTNDDWLLYDGDTPKKWDYNKFVRLRAWSDRSENTDNFIQLYWWVGDGTNKTLLQQYANGIGPRAGTYTLTPPTRVVYYPNGDPELYYWTHTQIPTDYPVIFAYRIHDFLLEYAGIIWVCPYSSYASQAGDLSNNNTNYVLGTLATSYITHFDSFTITVDTGDDGNIYVQIGGQECGTEPAVTIGRKSDPTLHALSVQTIGDGTVNVNSSTCKYYREGDVITLTPMPSHPSVLFIEWAGQHKDFIQDNGDGTYSLTMQGYDMNLTAVFESPAEVHGQFYVETICGDANALTMGFVRTQGRPARYDLIFSDAAKLQGFVDQYNQPMADMEQVEWAVLMPKNADNPQWYVRPDQYEVMLRVTDRMERQTLYNAVFTVLYPSWVILQRWNDIMTVTNRDFNGGYEFTHVQWYADGEPVDGRGDNNFFYYAGDGRMLLFGVPYRAELTRMDDGKTISTCDYYPYMHADTVIFKEDLAVAPRYAGNPRQVAVTTSLSGRYVVYDVSGAVVMTGMFGLANGSPDIVFPAHCPKGAYLIRFMPEGAKETVRKWSLY